MGACANPPLYANRKVARPYHVLICDDQPDVRHALHLMLKGHGYTTESVASPGEALAAARSGAFDLMLLDLNYTRDTTSGEEGLNVLDSLEKQGNSTPVVVMTAWGSIDLAVEAMRRGACDFIQKPWDNARALAVVRKQAESEVRRRTELEIAASVQQKLFPHAGPALTTIDYAGHCAAAQSISGDYYDFLDLAPHRVGFVLADVSGKGVPAALLMANLQACIRTQSAAGISNLTDCLHQANRHFYDSSTADRFATLFFGIYHDETRRLRYVNCGHCPPILLRASGALEILDSTATVLGAFTSWTCEEAEVELAPGDTLLLYSDGVTEAENPNGEEFGTDRLIAMLRHPRPAFALVQDIAAAVSEFSAGSRSDDVTAVAIRAH